MPSGALIDGDHRRDGSCVLGALVYPGGDAVGLTIADAGFMARLSSDSPTRRQSLRRLVDALALIRLFGFQRGVMVASRSQFGLPA